jgi:hypothetical protein
VTNTGIVRKRAAVVALVIVAAAPVVLSAGECTAGHSGAEAYQAFSDDAAATRDIASRSDPSTGPNGFA